MGETLTEADLEDCFVKLDADEDGGVSYQEFVAGTANVIPEVWWNLIRDTETWIIMKYVNGFA